MEELLNKVFLVKHDPWLDANNKQFPLLPEVPVLQLKRKKRANNESLQPK